MFEIINFEHFPHTGTLILWVRENKENYTLQGYGWNYSKNPDKISVGQTNRLEAHELEDGPKKEKIMDIMRTYFNEVLS